MFTASGWPLSFGCAVRWVSLRARVTFLADLTGKHNLLHSPSIMCIKSRPPLGSGSPTPSPHSTHSTDIYTTLHVSGDATKAAAWAIDV